jgi:EmrB/QacA subfamily drug resistance transporter
MTSSPSELRLPFAAIVLAMLPAVLDQTILATALPTIASDLGRVTQVSWLVTVYVVCATAATPLWGKLADRLSRKRLLQLALASFVTASAACGVARDMTQLVLVRGVQGLAAGGLMTLAMTAVGDLVQPRERGRYQGYIAMVFAGATVLGPLVGGLLTDHVSWRVLFYVNVPVGVGAFAALSATLPSVASSRPATRLDLLGAALLTGATVAFMLACVWGGERYAWGSAAIVGLFALAVVLALALAARVRRAADPIVPMAMLRTRAVAVASAGLFLGTAALFAAVVFVPTFLQVATSASPTAAGLLMVPMMLATTLATNLAGRHIARTGRYSALPPIGLAIMGASLALLGATAPEHSRWLTELALVPFGLGFGLTTQVFVVAVQGAVERRELGTATSLTGFFRALGGAVGAAALGAVFAAHGTDLTAGVQAVFLVGGVLAFAGAAVALRLPRLSLPTPATA